MSTRESLDLQASVFHLYEHLLHRTNFVDDVQVVFLVDFLIKSGCKLLGRVNQHFKPFTVDLESLRQRLSFTLNKMFSHKDHIVRDFPVQHVDFAACLVILLHQWCLIFDCLHPVVDHRGQLLNRIVRSLFLHDGAQGTVLLRHKLAILLHFI